MRIFFQSVLYLNVGLGALFFVIWLCTSVLMAEIVPSKNVASPPQPPQPPSPPAVSSPAVSSPAVLSSVGVDNNAKDNEQGNVQGNVQGNEQDNTKSSKNVASSPPQPPQQPASPAVPSSVSNVDSTHSLDKSNVNTLTTDTNKDLKQIENKILHIIELIKKYEYNPNADRNNPFVSTVVPKKEEPAVTETRVPNYPTGKYNLNEIKLVGIKWNSRIGPSTALFKTPDNNIHYLQLHDQIGRHRGIIYQLKEDEVVVLEPRLTGVKEEKTYVPIIIHLDRWNTQRKEG